MRPWVRKLLMVGLTVLMVLSTMFVMTTSSVGFGFDFTGDLYGAAQSILHGHNPYHPQAIAAEVQALKHGGTLGWLASPRYPPISMLAAIPLSLLPSQVGAVLFALISIGAVIGGIWLLGVRDWRCIIVASLSAPTLYGTWVGNITPVLLLGLALMWKFRDHSRLLPITTALVIGVKLFLWPMGAWLLVTRRFRQLWLAVALTIGAILASWAVIGFAGLAGYPKLLVNVAYLGEMRGSSLVTALLQAGLSNFAARATALAFTALLALAAWKLASRPDGDARAFSLMVVAALIASPVVWIHSLVLLFVPVALLSPRLSVLWFVPTLASFSPVGDVMIELIIVAALVLPLVLAHDAKRRPVAGGAFRVPDDGPSRAARAPVVSLLLAPF